MEFNKSLCSSCQICNRKGEADLLCTTVMEGEQREKACWCVCSDCIPHFQSEIAGYYKELMGD